MNMNNIPIFDPANYPAVLPTQGFIYSYQPPGMVRVRGNVQGDTYILNSSDDRWDVRYGGAAITLDWNHADLVDVNKSLIALWRHHLTEVIQTKSPPSIFKKFQSFRGFAHEISADLSLVSLLAIFSRLYANNRPSEFYYLRVFYNWGISHGIEVFDRRIQSIISRS